MIGRVTESMKYGSLTNSISNVQVKSTSLMEKISTKKNINRPSDDPVGVGKVLNYNSTLASIDQYQNNITNAQTWLSVTDTALSSIRDLISKAQTVAAAQYGADGSDETMDSSADFVSGLIDSALALMNTKQGDSYIFGGSRTDVPPFTLTPTATKIGTVTGALTNTSTGTVGIKSGSPYTGSENKTYAVKIIDAGALGTATCKVSNDEGKTWSDTQYIPSSGELNLGDGVTMTFTAGNYVANDLFTVNASVEPTIGAASAATANEFNGTVTSSGTYTGTENKTYAVKIINGGTVDTATYQISTDGGKEWSTTKNLPSRMLQGSFPNVTTDIPSTPIVGATVWNTINGANVANGTTFTINGTDHDGSAVTTGTYTISDVTIETVDGLLTVIKNTFGGDVTASIDSVGRITVTDNVAGQSGLTMSITTASPLNAIDFGTINAVTSKTINLDDGITMTFNDSGTQSLNANDMFTVNAYTAGYYQGDDNNLKVQIGKNNNFVYNITGSDAFTAANGPTATATIDLSTFLTVEDTITLTRGDSAGSWTITSQNQYPNMVITSMSDTQVTIDVNNDGTKDITLNLSDGQWQKGNTASFTIIEGGTPQAPTLSSVEVEGPGTVDLLGTLNALKSALEAHDEDAIAAQIDDLADIQTQVLQAQTEAGAKANFLELAKTSLINFNERITTLKSDIEDADLDKLIVSYQMEQVALEASYNMAAQIGKMTILDYLR